MFSKAVLVFCAQALLVQSALSQCTSRAAVVAEPGLISPLDLAAPYGIGAPTYGPGPYGIEGHYGVYGPLGVAAPCGLAAPGLAAPYGITAPLGFAAPGLDFTPTHGGGLPVSSGSSISPVGISVASENAYEGILEVVGELPFVGTVGLEGVLPTAGKGVVNHSCGNGVNAMVSDNAAFAPAYAGAYAGAYAPAAVAPFGAIAPGYATPALGCAAGWAGRGYVL